ncbi:alpha,alpha-trehalose glucohydrolase TreA/Ath1 [Cordyceps fumosorosea ARSEF 2679]|uniref:alpha,alpha-trehalase n=1 Tax=Cordyceps fumosorosea (strain ARSEF 2679) TaxID=1081104 RepID=A0A167M315_CORFA|nr:alpha,alpha-trehalose glucohydrolase TreA/Ath1 [Cordyceps fumosorosea ARSEF 2679]OAA53851.1 alpha,alpha-trehalose glucohydrolase TreA/Ath1 [Cordyceps fumosorosea ARSEF 2679]
MIFLTTRLAAASLLLGTAFALDVRVANKALYPNQYHLDYLGSNQARDGTSGANSVYNTAFPGVSWDLENWRLISSVLDQAHFQSRGSVANGFIGINSAGAGPFFEVDVPVNGDNTNGWPLFSRRQAFAGVSGFWDVQNGESFISGIPHWGGIVLDLGNGTYLDAGVASDTISDYSTTFNYKAGVLSWKYTWRPKGLPGTFKIEFHILTHKLDINVGVVRMVVEPSVDVSASIVNILEGACAVRSTFLESGSDGDFIYSAVHPEGLPNTSAYVFATLDFSSGGSVGSAQQTRKEPYLQGVDSSIGSKYNVKLQAYKRLEITKYVGIASTDAFKDPKNQAKSAAEQASKQGFRRLAKSHAAEWAQVMPEEFVDDFRLDNGALPDDPSIVDDSIMAIVNPFYLLQNTIGENALAKSSGRPLNENSIAVGGIGTETYAGMIFWDAETWMQPGLVAAFPEAAKTIVSYRVAHHEQAKRNAQMGAGTSKSGISMPKDAALYSWTSARFGNCTGTGACWDYEYHLNGDICLALINQWVASGDDAAFKDAYLPVFDSIATAYASILQPNGSKWTLTDMTDPDEYANHVDAGGYTMPLISQTLRYANQFRKQFGLQPNSKWTEMADNIVFLRENNITLEYTTMNDNVVVKQADVVLDTFPLQYTHNYGPEDSLNDLDYYAAKQSPDGPAMTWAIFSIVANQVSPSGCSAHTYARYSFSPYLRGPFYQLSEQIIDNPNVNGGTHPAFPFLTGHGGANQVTLFGYLGLRYLPDDKLHVDPSLPPQIPRIKYRVFYWRGWPITASSTYDSTTMARATHIMPLDTADQRYADAPIPVDAGTASGKRYELPTDGSPVTIPNRKTADVRATKGNVAQCRPVTSTQAVVPGQFPESAVDGARSTRWQPASAAELSSVTVALDDSDRGRKIAGCALDWAQSPPDSFTLAFHDEPGATGGGQRFTVNISAPWKGPRTDVHIPESNTTEVTFETPIAASRFATLSIRGNQGKGPAGATVAEWALITSS